ncbi:MAG TPA: DUF58 domain-containing protein [Anaerolineae bacterium]|nr:DUF58 domain-containing protein [Anaerolineae bacterium]
MLLTRRAFFLLLLTGLLLAVATFQSFFLYIGIGYLFFIIAMIVIDRALTPKPAAFTLTRTNDPRLSLGAENLVTVRVENHGTRAVRAIVRDEYPPEFRADRIFLDASANSAIEPNERQKLKGVPVRLARRVPIDLVYHVRPPHRGDYSFGDLNLRWWGVLGLIIQQARYPASAPVKVYPNLLDIRKYELQARKGQLQEIGLRQMRMLGTGTEFERLREYQLDDEFRRIDWKATARRGKPVTREFETEKSQTVMALLDVGRLMRPPIADPENPSGQGLAKLDYAVNAVLMLSYVASLRGDRVGLLTFADEVQQYLAPRAGRGQFYRMLATLYAADAQPVESDFVRAFSYLGAKHKKRSLIVIFSDIATGIAADMLVKQIAPLYPRHLPLLVAISDPTVLQLAQQVPHDSVGVYERAVAEQLVEERALILEKLRQRGVLTLDVPANQLTVAVVNKYLELKARGRI